MRKTIISLAAAGALVLTGCGTATPEPEPECAVGAVAEYDEDGWECEPDANGDGIDDENAEQVEGEVSEDEGVGAVKPKSKKSTKAKAPKFKAPKVSVPKSAPKTKR